MRSDGRGSLSAQRALVSGGSRGIGLAIAAVLKAEGAHVTILGRDADRLNKAVDSGSADEAIPVDLTDDVGVDAMLRNSGERFDILVANAGGAVTAPFAKTDTSMIRAMIDANLLSCTRLVQGLLPGMIARGRGRVVVISSTAGLKGYAYVCAYAAAKHAVLGYMRAVAAEIATTPVTINAVCPGFTDTDLVERSLATIMAKTGRSRAEALSDVTKHNPQGRLVAPDEVADAVLWLCGRNAGAVNGQAVAVAGGEI